MAYRNMNTAIYLLEGCPLVKGDENSLYFDDTTAQFNYFRNLAVNSTLSASFQRVNKNTLRVEAVYNAVQFCNYLMFTNGDARTPISDEVWYYAFIDTVNYVNDNVVEVSYTIDWLQTCMCYYTLGYCYVERGHTSNDLPYNNIMPEPINVTNYVYSSTKNLSRIEDRNGGHNNEYKMIGVITATDDVSTEGEIINGIYTGTRLRVYPMTDNGISAFRALVQEHLEDEDYIKLVYLFPAWFTTYSESAITGFSPSSSGFPVEEGVIYRGTQDDAILTTTNKTPLDGYVPFNNKCYCYPFTYYEINDGTGDASEFKYEMFENNYPIFEIGSSAYPPCSSEIIPISYKNGNTGYTGHTDKMVMKGFPVSSFSFDTYSSWMSQNAVPQLLNVASGFGSGLASTLVGAGTGNAITTLIGGMQMGNTILNAMSDFYQASIKADTVKGCVQSGNLFFGSNEMQFFGSVKCAVASEMRKIDAYFCRYGYSIGREIVPAKMNREHFRYLKTNGAVINGDIPQIAKVEIANRYNSGLRLFKSDATYGRCYMENNPA